MSTPMMCLVGTKTVVVTSSNGIFNNETRYLAVKAAKRIGSFYEHPDNVELVAIYKDGKWQ